jgi:hypothetical protein
MKVARQQLQPGSMDTPSSPSAGAATTLLDLPSSVLARIGLQLPVDDLLSLGRACKHAHEVVHDDTLIWRALCASYGVSSYAEWRAASFKHLYLGLLHRYREALGYWAGNVFLMGSLLRVRLAAPCVEGTVASAPCLNGPLRYVKVFEIAFADRDAAGSGDQGAARRAGSPQVALRPCASNSDSSTASSNSCGSTADSGRAGSPQQQQQQQQQPARSPGRLELGGSRGLAAAQLRCHRAFALGEDGACAHCGSAQVLRKPGRQQQYLHLRCARSCNQPLLELLMRHDPNRPAPPSSELAPRAAQPPGTALPRARVLHTGRPGGIAGPPAAGPGA